MRQKRFFYASLAVLCLSVAFAVALQAFHEPAVAQAEVVAAGVAEQLQNEFAAVAARVNPTVVAIDVAKKAPETYWHIPMPFPFPGFEDFFGFPGRPQQPRPQPPTPEMRGSGSGVIIDADNGYILTNNHVVGGADEITVTLIDGTRHKAELKGADPRTDIAVIEIEADGLQAIEWGDSDRLEVGHWVLAFGQPEGLRYTVTAGIVSAKGRANLGIIGSPGGITGYEDFIQTDAAINPGNSGGPLTDINGRLVGVNTAIATAGIPAFMGIGFAIPSNLAHSVSDQLITKGEVVRGWLGVTIGDFRDIPSEEIEKAFGVEKEAYGLEDGVLVSDVQAGQPAEKAGIMPGDVIVAYDGRRTDAVNDLRKFVAETPVGREVTVEVVRIENGRAVRKSIPVEIAKQPADISAITAETGVIETEIGISVQTLTPEMAKAFGYGVESGALVTAVEKGSRAATADIAPGDVITQVRYNGHAVDVESAADFEKALAAIPAGESFAIARNRGGKLLFITVR